MATSTIPNPSAQGTRTLTNVSITSTDARFKSASSSVSAYQTGQVVQVYVATRWDFSGTNLSEGDDVPFTLTGIPTPVNVAHDITPHSSRIFYCALSANKSGYFRLMKGSEASDNAPIGAAWVYVTAD